MKKVVLMKNNFLIAIVILLILEAAVSFGILWLFEWGIWMVVCQIIHAACLSIYFIWCLIPIAHDNKKPFTDDEVTAITFGGLMGIPMFAIFLIPVWLTMYGEDFLMKFNYIFGTDYTTTYEGGFISIWITCLVGLPLVFAILCSLYYAVTFVFGRNKKAVIRGFMYAAFVYICMWAFYKEYMCGYDHTQDQRIYETQMQKEEFDMDQKLESDKKRAIQRAVNNYGRLK